MKTIPRHTSTFLTSLGRLLSGVRALSACFAPILASLAFTALPAHAAHIFFTDVRINGVALEANGGGFTNPTIFSTSGTFTVTASAYNVASIDADNLSFTFAKTGGSLSAPANQSINYPGGYSLGSPYPISFSFTLGAGTLIGTVSADFSISSPDYLVPGTATQTNGRTFPFSLNAVVNAPAVFTGAASNTTYTTTDLNGTVNPNGLATTAHFEYGTTTSYGTNTADQSIGSGSSTVPVSASLSGLTPGTTYHYRLVATNAGGTSNGADATFFTGAGNLDLTLGGTGKVTTPIGGGDEVAHSVVAQADGKIILAGSSSNGSNNDFAVVRYNADGTLDTSFNGTGKVATDFGSGGDQANSVVLQSDGKIVVAGFSYNGSTYGFALARYNANGTLDTSFNGTGKVTTAIGSGNDYGNGVTVQADGKIVVAGGSSNGSNDDFALVRYNANGSLDTTFNGTGKVTTAIGSGGDDGYSVVVQSDGKIVVAGQAVIGGFNDFALVRYNINGTLDTSFNGTGKVTTAIGSGDDAGQSVTVQADGKIVAAGYATIGGNTDLALVRYNANGTLDTSFNGSGKVTTAIGSSDDVVRGMALQSNGKIIVGGWSKNAINNIDFAVALYNTNGSLDTSFNGTGKVTTAIGSGDDVGYGMALQGDGKIVVAGTSYNGSKYDFAVVRYLGFPLPTVTISAATLISANGATLNGTVNPLGQISTASFEYGLNTSYGSAASVALSPNNGSTTQSVSANLTGLSASTTYHYRLTATNSDGTSVTSDGTFTTLPPPVIAVEQPAGSSVSNGAARSIIAAVGVPGNMTFTIKNNGGDSLTGLTITKNGTNAADLSVTSNPTAPLSPGGSTTFVIQFNPSLSGNESAAIHIASNDTTNNPFNINLTGQVLLGTVDTDGDGMSDAAEFALSTLGFDWQVSQPPLVNTYYNNANIAGLFTQSQYAANRTAGQNDVINSPNTYGLYTTSQIQILNVGVPLLTKDAGTGKFKLTIGIQKTANLTTPFAAFPFTAPDTTINAQGNIEFLFTVPGNAAFFRVQAQ